ncbi:unnamed protein product [Rotaria sp. Silwood1]|nr:unnamed protein product [Rotaria sp. Silwood1]CAF1568568.1 unnamed protein product [Rotaria sp. Silwood1]CAF3679652.1 unnamed protein product [Rotaria sp. Silwood1]CAF4745672.1 unnamed protein product [Rotaria sp. Silwood1]
MLNLPSQQSQVSNANASDNSDKKKQSFSRLRIMKDFSELATLPSTCEVTQPDISDFSHFTVTISPDDGFYKGGRFIFSILISPDYPYEPPKIKCTQTIYHPNINPNGNVCLNILREDWKPMLTLVTVVLGLVFLFLEPNPDDPLNHEAAAVFKTDVNTFKENVCKTMAGPKYKRHAAVILPLFRRGKILNNYDLILDCTDKLLDQWRSKTDIDPDHVYLNIVDQCQNLSLSIFGFLAFDYDLQTIEEPNINKKNQLTKALNDFLQVFIQTIRLPNFIAKLYLKLSSRYQRAKATIDQYLNQIMEHEQRKPTEQIAEQKRTSLIASLITSLQQDEKLEAAKPEQQKKGLSRAEVIDELLLFLVAGSETTGSAIAWFIYLMSKHPRVQAKIKAELGDNKHNHMTVEQVESLTYLDCVLQEVFRFIPPVAGTTRIVTVDDRLPGSGVQLHKGDELLISFYNLTRDNRCWKIDPDLFYPERFQSEDVNHHSYASIPFGGGHRQCIGQDLARFELKVITTRLMQYVTFGDAGAEVNSGGYAQKVITTPKNVGVTITFD